MSDTSMFLIQIKIAQEVAYPSNHLISSNILASSLLFVISILVAALIYLLLSSKKQSYPVAIPTVKDPSSLDPVVLPPSKFDSRQLANNLEIMSLNRKRQKQYDKRKGLS